MEVSVLAVLLQFWLKSDHSRLPLLSCPLLCIKRTAHEHKHFVYPTFFFNSVLLFYPLTIFLLNQEKTEVC